MPLAWEKQQAARQSLAPSITAIYSGCHAACREEKQAPRQPNEGALSKQVGPQRFAVGPPVFVSAQPPCLQKSSKAGVPPLLPEVNRYADKKPSPVGRAEDMPVCLFAAKGRSLPRGTLCSSLPPLQKKFPWASGKPLSPRGMAQKPYRSTKAPETMKHRSSTLPLSTAESAPVPKPSGPTNNPAPL